MNGAGPNAWMPMYWPDYLADTSHLTTLDHGAYILLIAHYWQTKRPLPADDALLARITKMTKKQWNSSKFVLLALFEVDGEVWRHKRIDRELQIAKERYERRAAAGKKGGQVSRPKPPEPEAEPKPGLSNASAMRKQPQPHFAYAKSTLDARTRDPSPNDLQTAVEKWNQLAAERDLVRVELPLSAAHQNGLFLILAHQGGLEAWDRALTKIRGSPHCLGQNGSWRATFSFLLKPDKFVNLLNGEYDDRPHSPKPSPAPRPADRFATAIAGAAAALGRSR